MDAELKAKWLDALTSGQFVHGRGSLRKKHTDGDRHCCLGVLCVLMGREISANGQYVLPKTEVYVDFYLPADMSTAAGVMPKHQTDLAELNDAELGTAYPDTVIQYIKDNL